jgi:hypothetical protein
LAHAPLVDCVEQKRLKDTRDRGFPWKKWGPYLSERGPCGVRSLSRYHLDHPFVFHVGQEEYKVQYLPAEFNSGMFGGNSNWRGPVWLLVNALLIRGLLNLYLFYGDDFRVKCPK